MRKIRFSTRLSLRALLTDTLPYEVPYYFGNDRFYNYTVSSEDGAVGVIGKLLKEASGETEPYSFHVLKADGGERSLQIVHPGSQIAMCRFYGRFDGFIENLCRGSAVSLRSPSRVGSAYYESQFARIETEESAPEPDPTSFEEQPRTATSYFSYQRFTLNYKFFDSNEFLELERRFPVMLRLDVTKCFESIYTHSISWAVRGKRFSKEYLRQRGDESFEQEFDKVIRNANWGETAGIVVGPEFSRVFAEIIFQSVDKIVLGELRRATIACELRRYIDDFYVFLRRREDVDRVRAIVGRALKGYRLHLNEAKEVVSCSPLISPLTVARRDVIHVASSYLASWRGCLFRDEGAKTEGYLRSQVRLTWTQIRHSAVRYGTTYRQLASPLLGSITKGLERVLREVQRNTSLILSVSDVRSFGMCIVELMELVLHHDCRMSTCNKVAKAIYVLSLLCKRVGGMGGALRSAVYRLYLGLDCEGGDRARVVGRESINIAVVLDSIAEFRSIRPIVCHGLTIENGRLRPETQLGQLSYFELMSVLYFSRGFRRCAMVIDEVFDECSRRIQQSGTRILSQSECTLLFVDLLACPYISEGRKIPLYQHVWNSIEGTKIDDTKARQHIRGGLGGIGFVEWRKRHGIGWTIWKRELRPAYE